MKNTINAIVPLTSLQNVKIPLWGLFILAILGVLYFAKSVFVPAFLAIIFSFLLVPPVKLLQKIRIPQPLGALVVLLITLGLFAVLIYYMADPIRIWLERIPAEVHEIETKLGTLKSSFGNVQETTAILDEKLSDLTSSGDGQNIQQVVVQRGSGLYLIMDNTQAFVVGTLSFLVLLYFLLAFGDSLVQNLTRTWSDRAHRLTFLRINQAAQVQVSYYLLLITIINIGLGIATSIAMWLLGMPTPILWGVSAALFNYIPYIGPALNIILITLVSLLTYDSFSAAMLPPLVLLTLNMIEGQMMQPLFVGRMFTINPVYVFFSVIFWGWLWGVAGVFMAVPILMILNIFIEKMRELLAEEEAERKAAEEAALEAAALAAEQAAAEAAEEERIKAEQAAQRLGSMQEAMRDAVTEGIHKARAANATTASTSPAEAVVEPEPDKESQTLSPPNLC